MHERALFEQVVKMVETVVKGQAPGSSPGRSG
ncbi:MAG: hypothetical protein KatS3mg082_0591 [Nitrospiraceae bacterium]|nr:MAG: hypothetical protein KatS3mg082_0591 [Nitrospiraceae bacterium]